MALVEGTNCGFVTVAPVADPDGCSDTWLKDRSNAGKFTSPADAVRIIEIGCYINGASEAADMDLGLYDHNSGDDNPENRLFSTTIAKGLDAGWKVASGLDIAITGNTIYWIAASCANTATATSIDYCAESGAKRDYKTTAPTLTDPWGASTGSSAFLVSIYAVYETAVGTNIQINISDVWKDVESLQINIGDVWKDVVQVQQNIGDAWKTVFG